MTVTENDDNDNDDRDCRNIYFNTVAISSAGRGWLK